jgi:hypothetical protein
MIVAVQATAADSAGMAATHQLRGFVRRLQVAFVLREAAHAAARGLLAVAVPGIVLAWLLPPWRWPLLGGGLGFALLLALGRAGRAAARAGRAELLAAAAGGAQGDASLAALGDELATWLESVGDRVPPRLLPWLTQDLSGRVPQLDRRAVAAVGPRSVGRLAWLLPIALLLLLLWALAEWLQPPWLGVLGGASPPPAAGSGAGGAEPGDGEGGGAGKEGAPEAPQRAERRPPASPPPEPEAASPPSPPPTPEAPAPLLDLPDRQQFLLPDFIGDGPTSRVRMHAAERTEGPAGTAATSTTTPTPEAAPVPPPRDETFRRAEEQALRSRHVPPHERAMVQRFFQALREAAK